MMTVLNRNAGEPGDEVQHAAADVLHLLADGAVEGVEVDILGAHAPVLATGSGVSLPSVSSCCV